MDMIYETVGGLYGQSWRGLVVSAANRHPAKFSRRLVHWLVAKGLTEGWWDARTAIIDPFGGVGLGGLVCADLGLAWYGVELEPRFVEMAWANFDCNYNRWKVAGSPLPDMVQGDSRNLLEIVRTTWPDLQFAGITSAPFSPPGNQPIVGMQGHRRTMAAAGLKPLDAQQMTEGNLQNLAGITSPPYAATIKGSDLSDTARHRKAERYASGEFQAKRPDVFTSQNNIGAKGMFESTYGTQAGQIGHLGGITSPPYANRVDDHGVDQAGYEGQTEKLGKYGMVEGRLGNLRLSALTSPPYGVVHTGGTENLKQHGTGLTQGEVFFAPYGATTGNLGNSPETYWDAIIVILNQLYALFPPNGHLAWVVKAFVKDKKIVDLPGMTWQVMRDRGWQPVAWIECPLTTAKGKAYKSFFRRLHETKYPDLAINEEVVLVVKK